MPTENTNLTPVAETSATPVAVTPVNPDPATTFNQVPPTSSPSAFQKFWADKKKRNATIAAIVIGLLLFILALVLLTRPAENIPVTPPIVPPPTTDNTQTPNPTPNPTPTPATPTATPINGTPTDQRVLTDNRNTLYIGTALNPSTNKEETALYYYTHVNYGNVNVTGNLHFNGTGSQGVNIEQLKNRKIVHVFDQSVDYGFYTGDTNDNKTIAVSVIRNANLLDQAVNEVYLIDVETMKMVKVWEKNFTTKKYDPYFGAASPTMVSKQSNTYVDLRIAPCYACDGFAMPYHVILNVETKNEVIVGNYGDLVFDLSAKKVTGKKYIQTTEACATPGQNCVNGQAIVFKTTSETKTFDLP